MFFNGKKIPQKITNFNRPYILQTIICFNDPASDPFISQKERDHLQAEMGQLQRKTDLPPTPWRAIVTSTPVLVLILAQVNESIYCKFILRIIWRSFSLDRKDWTRLGSIRYGQRFTKIYEGSLGFFGSRSWHLRLIAISGDVDCFYCMRHHMRFCD